MSDYILKNYKLKIDFLRKFKNALSQYTSIRYWDSSPLYFSRKDLNNLMPLPNISPLYIKEMNMDDKRHIKEWLNIINQSFNRELDENLVFKLKPYPI